MTLARPCSPGPLSVGARVLCPSLAHSPLQLSHRPRGVGRTQRVRAALAQGHEGGVAAIPSVRRALPYPAATPTPGWGRTSAKSRAGSPALSKRSRSVACFFLLSPSNFCGRGKEENGRAGTASACAAGAHRGAAGAGNAKQVLQACLLLMLVPGAAVACACHVRRVARQTDLFAPDAFAPPHSAPPRLRRARPARSVRPQGPVRFVALPCTRSATPKLTKGPRRLRGLMRRRRLA